MTFRTTGVGVGKVGVAVARRVAVAVTVMGALPSRGAARAPVVDMAEGVAELSVLGEPVETPLAITRKSIPST
jgi:hypothetical protein